MPKSSPISKFLRWAGGIVGTVIASVLIYHFTTPKPAPLPAPPITFEGMVINGAVNAPLQGAMVSFEITDAPGGPYHDFSDEHGSYRIDFAGLKTTSSAVLRAQANGFQPSQQVSLASIATNNRADFVLHPVPPSDIPGPGPSPTPQPTMAPHPPIYVRKLPVQVIRVQTLTNH
jgi:hypothetical protein